MEPLTPRQAKILQLVRDAIEANGYPPTRAEICGAMGFSSPNAAEKHLRVLERKGAIEMLAGASRGIRLKTDLGLPLIGPIAAGSPILAEANVQARYRVDPALFKPRADYLLKVRGLSMRDAGILDGDLLAVHATHEARSGQIVVARLHDEVTVKRYKRAGSRIQLLPENPDFKTIEVDPRRDALAIEGVAVGIIRSGRTL
jgi:repressor LexA